MALIAGAITCPPAAEEQHLALGQRALPARQHLGQDGAGGVAERGLELRPYIAGLASDVDYSLTLAQHRHYLPRVQLPQAGETALDERPRRLGRVLHA
jgi:hypothetical protein